MQEMLGDAEPVILPDELLEWIWRAWHRLDPERSWQAGGMGPSHPCGIPWTAVERWARHHHLDDEAFQLLDDCIVEMDKVYSAWWREQAKVAAQKPEAT